jgi:hypothetical protein
MTGDETTNASTTPPNEQICWVRYAADCAERVLDLTGEYRHLAEAAIQAARAWADDPTEERLKACRDASSAAHDSVRDSAFVFAFSVRAAGWAALATIDDLDVAALCASRAAAYAADAAAVAAIATVEAVYDGERAWQTRRRRHYWPTSNAGATEG